MDDSIDTQHGFQTFPGFIAVRKHSPEILEESEDKIEGE